MSDRTMDERLADRIARESKELRVDQRKSRPLYRANIGQPEPPELAKWRRHTAMHKGRLRGLQEARELLKKP